MDKLTLTRRKFLQFLASSSAGAVLTACGAQRLVTPRSTTPATTVPPVTEVAATEQPTDTPETAADATPLPVTATPSPSYPYLAVAHGEDPQAVTRAAIAALGGIERFVKPGDRVILKPNICTDYYTYEYAATTNPEVMAALTALCLGAGARSVTAMDSPFGGTPQSAYARSGIEAAVNGAGGVMEIMKHGKFQETPIPEGESIQAWPVYQELLNADVVINVPIAKHHNLARLTLGCKNLMGCILNPGGIHADLHTRIVDLVSLIRPQLTVVDAIRTLVTRGPTGGNLDDVKIQNTIIASADIVAADAYATRFFDREPDEIGYIREAAARGLGTLDLSSVKIEEVSL